jgi:hypothetical protein
MNVLDKGTSPAPSQEETTGRAWAVGPPHEGIGLSLNDSRFVVEALVYWSTLGQPFRHVPSTFGGECWHTYLSVYTYAADPADAIERIKPAISKPKYTWLSELKPIGGWGLRHGWREGLEETGGIRTFYAGPGVQLHALAQPTEQAEVFATDILRPTAPGADTLFRLDQFFFPFGWMQAFDLGDTRYVIGFRHSQPKF